MRKDDGVLLHEMANGAAESGGSSLVPSVASGSIPYAQCVNRLIASGKRGDAYPQLLQCSPSDRATIERIITVVREVAPAGSDTPVFDVRVYPELGRYCVYAFGVRGKFTYLDFFSRVEAINDEPRHVGWKPVCVGDIRLHFPKFWNGMGTDEACSSPADLKLWDPPGGASADTVMATLGGLTHREMTHMDEHPLPVLVIPVLQSSSWSGGGGGAAPGSANISAFPGTSSNKNGGFHTEPLHNKLDSIYSRSKRCGDAAREIVKVTHETIGRNLMWLVVHPSPDTFDIIFKRVDNACYSADMLQRISGAAGITTAVSLHWPAITDASDFSPLLKVTIGTNEHSASQGGAFNDANEAASSVGLFSTGSVFVASRVQSRDSRRA